MVTSTIHPLLGSDSILRGLDRWLVDYLTEAERETGLLRENGALAHAAAREAVIRGLLRHAAKYLEEEVGVSEAADLLGQSEETVRRAIRDGRLPDNRTKPRGHHRARRGDLLALRGGKKNYDPNADAQDIAKLRRSVR
jgi:excisionase family DNA binding protein